jgi:hypothetical protein
MGKADGIASVLIGLLLVFVALLLIMKYRALIVGEGADASTLRVIRSLALADPDIEQAGYPFTMYFGPYTILLTMTSSFSRACPAPVLKQLSIEWKPQFDPLSLILRTSIWRWTRCVTAG